MKLCVVGTGRCGTTLLWRMLNAHPDLFVFRETHWLPALWERFGTALAPAEAMLDVVARTRFAHGVPVTPLDAEAIRAAPGWAAEMTVRGFADHVGLAHARAENKAHWADKTPDYGYFVGTLQVLWPELRVVHVVRNGMDVARSMAGHPGYRTLALHRAQHWPALALDYAPPAEPPPPGDFAAMAELWHDRLVRIEDEAQRLAPGSLATLRYEDLRSAPRREMARLAAFAGLAAPSSWLDTVAAQVEPGRGRRVHPAEDYARLPERPRRLQQRLGYPLAADTPA